VKINLNKFILNPRVILLFSEEICSWTTLAEGPENFFNGSEPSLGDTDQQCPSSCGSVIDNVSKNERN